VAWVALWRAFHQTRKYSFLKISPKLLDFSPFFFLIFSPLGTEDFLMLLERPGDGYSLLCSKKQPPRHTFEISAKFLFKHLSKDASTQYLVHLINLPLLLNPKPGIFGI
jgi:hypothetical protein